MISPYKEAFNMAHSVFVIQENENAVKEITVALSTNDFNIVGSSTSGEDGFERVVNLKPELVITGLAVSGLDGMEIIERVKSALPETKIVVVSSVASEEIFARAISKGAHYYFITPISAELLRTRILEVVESNQNRYERRTKLDERISKIFISVGIPPHIKGYAYLREGVKMAVSDPEIIN